MSDILWEFKECSQGGGDVGVDVGEVGWELS
jgi:hypothetical protein